MILGEANNGDIVGIYYDPSVPREDQCGCMYKTDHVIMGDVVGWFTPTRNATFPGTYRCIGWKRDEPHLTIGNRIDPSQYDILPKEDSCYHYDGKYEELLNEYIGFTWVTCNCEVETVGRRDGAPIFVQTTGRYPFIIASDIRIGDTIVFSIDCADCCYGYVEDIEEAEQGDNPIISAIMSVYSKQGMKLYSNGYKLDTKKSYVLIDRKAE